jgi:CheY-like chemotaxis protein
MEVKTMDGHSARILIIDDQPLVLAGLVAILEGRGFSCRTAEDGFTALRHFREALPDVILCDLSMPNMSGFELLSIVRREYPQIAVIVISGEYLANFQRPGVLMNAFFTKGQYHPEELIAKINELHLQASSHETIIGAELAPLWMSRQNQTSLIVTCNHCLDSFAIEKSAAAQTGLQSVDCPSCGALVRYAEDSIVMQVLEPIRQVETEPVNEFAEAAIFSR